MEKTIVPGGSELFTIFSRTPLAPGETGPPSETPLVSVLRDTLGDDKPENDRLRYVWMLSYTRPSLSQRLSALVPFLYTRTTNKGEVGSAPPPSLMDVQASDKILWSRIFWAVLKNLVLGEVGVGIEAPAGQYRQNFRDRRRTAITGALAVLSLYQEVNGQKLLSDTELRDIQARLSLSDKMFGWHMQSENLGRVFEKNVAIARDVRGHNWELLRQYSESQHLYFEPLEMPDGASTHAIVWTSVEDIAANKGKEFNGRFLNFKNPWTDKKLARWKGYTQVRWFDAEDRQVEEGTPNARSKTMIPLAVYGLDHPKIPILLVDLRDNFNAKKREMTRRILIDLTGNVLSLGHYGGIPLFFGRFIYEFAMGRRGMDMNQRSRLRSYAQLKLLLSLDESLEHGFKGDLERRVEFATLNPLENDTDVETRIAKKQYENLMAYAQRPDGLSKKIALDRREEMVRLKHGRKDCVLFTIAHVFSFGLYTHREESTPELVAQMDLRRQLDHHERIVREVAFASAKPEIDTDVEMLTRSLQFISENGAAAASKTVRSLAKIFAMSDDEDIRLLSMKGLYKINSSSAKKELLAIYGRSNRSDQWHELSSVYLKRALEEGQRMTPADAQRVAVIAVN